MSYLNAAPLVWGLLHGPQKGLLDLRFEIPSVCASLLRAGEVDIGLVPSIELERQPIDVLPGLGIASMGAVGSILLVSNVPLSAIQTIAVDESSRTSVVLARILLEKKFRVAMPKMVEPFPDVPTMLKQADACLVIGDPALRFGSSASSFKIFDLGAEWTTWTGLPMVYAVWAARGGFDWGESPLVLQQSWEVGRRRIREIASGEAESRGIDPLVALDYLTSRIKYELGPEFQTGLRRFLDLAREGGLL